MRPPKLTEQINNQDAFVQRLKNNFFLNAEISEHGLIFDDVTAQQKVLE